MILTISNHSKRSPILTNDVAAALHCRDHERRESRVVGRVDVGAARQERLDALDAAAVRRHVERRPAQTVPAVKEEEENSHNAPSALMVLS